MNLACVRSNSGWHDLLPVERLDWQKLPGRVGLINAQAEAAAENPPQARSYVLTNA